MATKKTKQSSTGVADAPHATNDKPAIRPPGKVRTGGFGPATTSKPTHGVERLRVLMNLSKQCAMTQLCNDAAIEIEQLREQVDHQPRSKPFKVEEQGLPI